MFPKSALRSTLTSRLHRRRFGNNGSIPQGGGAFSRREHADEEQYFRRKERDEIENLKRRLRELEEKVIKREKEGEGSGDSKK